VYTSETAQQEHYSIARRRHTNIASAKETLDNMSSGWGTLAPGMKGGAELPNGHSEEENDSSKYPKQEKDRRTVVVVGLGMVGIAFM
jgi:hypothetical protein